MGGQFADILLIAGRILLGGLFVFGGIKHFFMVPLLTEVMTQRGVPFPKLTLIAGSTFQTVVGALLIFGIFVTPASFGLIAFTVLASVMFLNFWDMPAGEQREAAKNNVAVNVGVIGGLLLAAAQAM
jgi:putative oxidoreductase